MGELCGIRGAERRYRAVSVISGRRVWRLAYEAGPNVDEVLEAPEKMGEKEEKERIDPEGQPWLQKSALERVHLQQSLPKAYDIND